MAAFLSFQEWVANRVLTEKEKADTPDYSIDRWIKSAQQLGADVDSFVGQAKKKDTEIDKELEKKKKEKPPEEVEEKEDEESKDSKPPFDNKEAWDKLKTIAKERAEKKDNGRESNGTPARSAIS